MTPPTHAGEEGVQDVRVKEAIFRSAYEGRPVRLERLDGRDLFRGRKPARIERGRA